MRDRPGTRRHTVRVAAPPPRLIWLLRHAKTVPDPPPGATDHERPLAPRGRRDADALAQHFAKGGDRLGFTSGQRPQLVLCSTATRTTQTAQRVLALAPSPPPVRYLRALYGASPEGVVDELHQVEDEVASVMLVGHNPTAHELAARLGAPERGGSPVERRGFPTCALAVFSVSAPLWEGVELGGCTLLGLFTPPY